MTASQRLIFVAQPSPAQTANFGVAAPPIRYDSEIRVLVEAKRLCLAHCRAGLCRDGQKCKSGAEGPHRIYLAEARQRVHAVDMDQA